MKLRFTFFIMFVCAFTNAIAGTFSPAKGNGYFDKKSGCIIFENANDGTIKYTSDGLPLKDLVCYELTFGEDKIDSLLINKKNYTLSADTQSVTIKKLSANKGYTITYNNYSYGDPVKEEAYTYIVNYLPISHITFPQDTILCDKIDFTIEPEMQYFNMYGNIKNIEREISVKYISYGLRGEQPSVDSVSFETSASRHFTLDSLPFVETDFKVRDLTAANKLKLQSQLIATDTFHNQAVVAFPTMETNSKQEHEGDESHDTIIRFFNSPEMAIEKAKDFRQSGPLYVNFNSYANDSTNHYEWAFASGDDAAQSNYQSAYTYFGKNINAFKIEEPGLHCIELTVSNIRNDSVCKHRSYGCIQIQESKLQVPNAFTPNGDGSNDEFRVAYRSIETFEISIYDEWGRRVYKSNDIRQGWDGTFNGKRSSIGVYYYVIKALGTDGAEFNKKGSINLIRTKN